MFSVRNRQSSNEASGDSLRIRVADGAFDPDEIHAVAGRTLQVTFHREDRSACTERVVFPALVREQELPLGRDVTVELTPQAPGESEFTCGMGMLHGRLIVTAPAETSTAGCRHGGHEHADVHGGGHERGGGCCGGHDHSADRAAGEPLAASPDKLGAGSHHEHRHA